MKNTFGKISFNLSLLACSVLATHCGNSNFRGSSAKKQVTPVDPVVSPGPAPTIPPSECVKRDIPSAVDLLFALDNSGSMLGRKANVPGSDCENPRNGLCSRPTKREDAVIGTQKNLLAKETSFAVLSGKNNLATLKFPAHDVDDFDKASAQDDAEWTKLGEFDASSLLYTRRPVGYTPFNSAFEEAGKLFQKVSDSGNTKLLVFITDGESTDPDSKTADGLRAELPTGTKIAVFMISNGKDLETRLSEHYTNLTVNLKFDPEAAKIITSGEGLAKTLADPGLYFEASASELSAAVEKIVTVTTECK